MQGKLTAGIAACAMAVCCFVPVAGADDRRGGNHGCDNSTGEFYSDHFFEPGDDSVRMDAKGIEAESGEDPFVALPKSIQTSIRGGTGNDSLRGHKGFDNLNAGPGDDVIKADDGKQDIVNCGTGEDKADVDNKDDVSRCEKLT